MAFVTITRSLEISPTSASPPASWRETTRPLAFGDERCWSLTYSRLLYISDWKTSHRFLVDTGAEVIVIPPTAADRKHKHELRLRAVNGSPIPTYGTWSITLDLGLRRVFRWIFIVADIQMPILGADFLREYGLLVNLRQRCLLDATTSLQSKDIIYHIASPSPSLTQLHKTEYHAILAEFPSVTKPCTSPRPARHTVTHHIRTTRPTSPLSSSQAATWPPPHCKEWVWAHDGARNHSTFCKPMVITPPHGP